MAEKNEPVGLGEEEFDDFIEEKENVVIDFWATWCSPCLAMEPVIEELAEKYSGRVAFGKVNVEENGGIASRYGIQAIPAFTFIKNGEVVDQSRGALSQSDIEDKIEDNFDL